MPAQDDGGWTVQTLKELIEVRLKEHDRFRDVLREEDRRSREADRAALQREKDTWIEEVKRRLLELNDAHARAERVSASTVSRVEWDAAWKELRLTLERLERDIGSRTIDSVFRAYRDETSKALTLKEGQGKGIGMTTQTLFTVLVALGTVAAIVVAVGRLGL